jgi:hypothetical protein
VPGRLVGVFCSYYWIGRDCEVVRVLYSCCELVLQCNELTVCCAFNKSGENLLSKKITHNSLVCVFSVLSFRC